MGFTSNHKAVIGIQARMSSMRFPGKVLAKLQGKTIIEHVVNSCLNLDIPCFVLTSKEPNDDQLVAFLKNRKIDSYRGDLNNVLSRFKSFAEEFDFDEVVRISADSPLLHHEVIKKVLSSSQNVSESDRVSRKAIFICYGEDGKAKIEQIKSRACNILYLRKPCRIQNIKRLE